ncbi:phosphatase and actin regulator 3a [Clupea harengus]|uniref:Phosphatase and actin regulator n=1 Tax=Clupea harengus TaxID=7950 RepID=A0A6P8FHX5_CLUHA|nr:phosphatase and actin regulator 3a [Clupea harengus]
MAASDETEQCMLQRCRSQSDPNILTESCIDLSHSTDVMDEERMLRSSCLVTGVHTPPIRRNSKLATLGRIFRPWKWRKKKTEKMKQSSTDVNLACGLHNTDRGRPIQGVSDMDSRLPPTLPNMLSVSSMEYLGSDQEPLPPPPELPEEADSLEEPSNPEEEEEDESGEEEEEEEAEEEGPLGDNADGMLECIEGGDQEGLEQALQGHSPPGAPDPLASQLGSEEDEQGVAMAPVHQSNSFLLKEPPRCPEGPPAVPLRGPLSNLGGMHPPLPPSCIIEELHRALANKLRQDRCRELPVTTQHKTNEKTTGHLMMISKANYCSNTMQSIEREPSGEVENRRDSEENKENLRIDQWFTDESGRIFDQESWNDSVISGSLPRRMRTELLAVKLRNRPSKQELEDRNIFPTRSDQERQEIRQQIESKLAKRLSQRPAVEELEGRNILKQRNDQTEQEERREIKQRLNRKLNQRPTVDELRERKILIRFSDYVEVAKAQDYDRRADKPWTRLSAADKAAIRKELNEFKSTEMEVHASSKHLTRFHRP